MANGYLLSPNTNAASFTEFNVATFPPNYYPLQIFLNYGKCYAWLLATINEYMHVYRAPLI